MPYIDKDRRLYVLKNGATTAGELNYLFTYWLNKYLKDNGEKYQTYNDMIGALEGTKIELYRRKIAPYEDMKKRTNGDVY